LDIVCRTPDKTLTFVEVKTLRQAFPDAAIKELAPEENLTKVKLLKLQRIAEMFAGNHPELIDEKRGWRIDLLAIKIFPDNTHDITHYENI
jgi:Holliday junction resolvase-like predicted endonuclease